MAEVWRDIKGYEGLYQVSNLGSVRTVERYVYNPGILGDGEYRRVPATIRKHNIVRGYHTITLSKDGKNVGYRVARLMLEAFDIPAPSDMHQATYLDGNKDNLELSNLAWMIPSDVMKLAADNGRINPQSYEQRMKTSEYLRERWKDNSYRISETNRMKKRWDDQEFRAKTLESMRRAGEERRKRNELIKAETEKQERERRKVPDLPGETWLPFPEHEDAYMISSCGRVKSIERTLPHKEHGTWHLKEKLLKPSKVGPGKKRYSCVSLHVGNGNMVSARVHRAVAVAFIPNPDNLPQVNHIDGNTENNNVSNLEWVTGKQNMEHAWQNGLCENIIKAKQRPVLNVDTGMVFPSATDADKHYSGKYTGAVSKAARGKTEHAYGYKWTYVKENE